jgi:hypothetical protein
MLLLLVDLFEFVVALVVVETVVGVVLLFGCGFWTRCLWFGLYDV